MNKNEKPQTTAVAAASTEPSSRRLGLRTYTRTVQNFLLVWLDGNIDDESNDDYRRTIPRLRQIINTVNTFTDIDECIDFITDAKEEMVFLIISEALSQITIPILQEIPHVLCIYIFCGNKARHEKLAQQWPKVKGIYTDITPIYEALKQATQHCDQNMVSISFVKSSDEPSAENLDQLDQSFIYTQILKDILTTIDFEEEHIHEFITYCREQLAGNIIQLENVEKFKREYHRHQPIWWYTYNCFLYSMLNRALRTMEVDLIIKMAFFLRDLHQHITALHFEQYGGHNYKDSFTVYRGQGLSPTDFDELIKTQGGLLSFNNFLSTSLDRAVSFTFADSILHDPNLIGVLFEITINPSISSTSFANIRDGSYYRGEEEVLFSIHSVFRIEQIKQIEGNNRLWQVDLILTSDNDPQLRALTKCIEDETEGSTGWHRLGELMIKLGHFNQAEELNKILLQQTTNEDEKAYLFHQLGRIKNNQGKYEEAIEFYEKALEIYQKTLPENHPDLATSYNNIGLLYDNMGEYSKALSYYEKDLEISQKTLPENHPHLATSYNNIGGVYDEMGEYSKALSSHEKALEIYQKTLPVNHPDLATSYSNIGGVYDEMGKYSKALLYYEKAVEICQKSLLENHPSLATSYNNIGLVYSKMGEYSKTLSYYEKALQIFQKTLPANHPDLATSYNNIGGVYDEMEEYSKALLFYKKALKIFEHSLPPNHPNIRVCKDNVEYVKKKL